MGKKQMSKTISPPETSISKGKFAPCSEAIGIDVGDRYSHCCLVDASGEVAWRRRVASTREALRQMFSDLPPTRIALEVGFHSAWMAEILEELGHEVLVANARKLALISGTKRKNDGVDSEILARLARSDPKLLFAIEHRGEETRTDLAILRTRAAIVAARTKLINHVRGAIKPFGLRLQNCGVEVFGKRAGEQIPDILRPALIPLIETIAVLTRQIRTYDTQIKALRHKYADEVDPLQQVRGVGPLTALAFVLTIGDPNRFEKRRNVPAYFGLVPGQDQSGNSDPQQRISKEGDSMVRSLLVQCAHYILGPFGGSSDLRNWGEAIAARGGKAGKKRAAVAVARKLAVLLHCLWVTKAQYEPHRARTG